MLIGIIAAALIVALLVLLRWADRRERASGRHNSRKMSEIMSTMRAERRNMRNLRRKGGYGGVSPHQFRNKQDPYRQ